MKKIMFSFFAFIMLFTLAVPVFAASGLNEAEQSIIDAAKKEAAGFTMNNSQKAKYESMLAQVTAYFKQDDVDVTAEAAETVVSCFKAAAAELPKDVTHYSLTQNVKAGTAVSNYINKACDALNVKVTVEGSVITLTDLSGRVVASSKEVVNQTGGSWVPFVAMVAFMAAVVGGSLIYGFRKKAAI